MSRLNKPNSKIHRYLTCWVLFALLFNSVGSVFASASILSHAQSFADDDKTLICTGSSYQWISMQYFHQTGEIKFVEPPADAPQSVTEIKCSYAYLSDTGSAYLFSHSADAELLPVTQARPNAYITASYSLAKHRLAVSRAPPFFS